jgi:hypothetical protein
MRMGAGMKKPRRAVRGRRAGYCLLSLGAAATIAAPVAAPAGAPALGRCVQTLGNKYTIPRGKRQKLTGGLDWVAWAAATATKEAADGGLSTRPSGLRGWRAALGRHAAHKEDQGNDADQAHDQDHQDVG